MSGAYDYAYPPDASHAYPPPGSYPPQGYGPPPYPAPPPTHVYGPPSAYPGYPGAYGSGPYDPLQHAAAPATDEVRTIFITGFPPDVKERELNNLLRFLHGYEASQMNWKDSTAQGFALFTSAALARAACESITQLVFDESSVLRCEMARKNMYIKEDPAVKRPRTTAGLFIPAPSAGPPPSAYAGPGGYSAPSTRPVPYVSSSGGGGSGGGGGENPPCNTLFIGNLGDNVSEVELKEIFGASPVNAAPCHSSTCQGFKFLKLVRGRNVTCFVEYEDVKSAQDIHAAHQGVVVPSSDRGPLRVQFAKNPFGKKRDMSGQLIDTLPRDYPAPGTV